MKKVIVWFSLILLLSPAYQEQHESPIRLHESRNATGTQENPQARAEFEFSQIRNPKTGTVPENIRHKEIMFSEQHPFRATLRKSGTVDEDWELAGPFNVGGRTRAVALDVQNENMILSGGVSGGIWKSTNGGASWIRTSAPENRNSITTLAQDTRDGKENIWYYGTGELLGNSSRGGGAPYRGDGLLKSIDSGESWVQLSSTKDADPSSFGSQFQYIWRIVTNDKRKDADELFAAAYGGILRSEDGGDTWSVVLGEPLNNLPPEADLNKSIAPFYTEIAKNSNGHFYASLSHFTSAEDIDYSKAGFYWSSDGNQWFNISPPEFHFVSLARTVISAEGNYAYFFSSLGDSTFLLRYEFSDTSVLGTPAGIWTNLSENLPNFEGIAKLDTQRGYNMMIRLNPDHPSMIFLGGTNLYRSMDGFESTENTTLIGGYEDAEDIKLYASHHPDQHEILFFPSNSNQILSANDGGLYVTKNSSASRVSWYTLNNGYVTSQFYSVNIPKHEVNNTITGGLQDNGSLIITSNNENASWTKVFGGDGAYTAAAPQGIYYVSAQNSEIFRLVLNANFNELTFARVDPTDGASRTDSEYLFINPYVLDPNNPNIMYLTGGNAIWRNHNLAQIPSGSQETTDVNWDLLNTTILTDGSIITALEVTNDSKYLYYGTNNSGLFRLENSAIKGSETKEEIQQSNAPKNAYVSCIAANPENGSEILTIYSNYETQSIFHSSDAGKAFENVSGNLEEFPDGSGNGPSVRWAEIVPLNVGTRYFVGTSTGLYSTDRLDGASTTWVKESPDKIGKSVVKMMDYRPLDGRFVVATHGNGVFRTTIDEFKQINPLNRQGEKFSVAHSYPNPFSNTIYIEFKISKTQHVRVDIFDMFGKHIRNLLLGSQYAGKNVISWDGQNQHGKQVQNGMYIYRILSDGHVWGGRVAYNRSKQ